MYNSIELIFCLNSVCFFEISLRISPIELTENANTTVLSNPTDIAKIYSTIYISNINSKIILVLWILNLIFLFDLYVVFME